MMTDAPANRWRLFLQPGFGARAAGLAGLALLSGLLARAPLAWLLALAGGAGLGIATLVEPAIGLAAVGFFIPLGSLSPLALGAANIVDLLVIAVAASWLIRGLASQEIRFRRPPLLLSLLLLIWCVALSLIGTGSWKDAVPELAKWLELGILYAVASQCLDSKRIWWVVGALLAAGALQAVVGAFQFLLGVGPEAFVLAGRFMRAYGTFRQPNPYAGYLGYLAPVAASLALTGFWMWWQRRNRVDLLIGAICGLVAVALIAGIGMSWSRGAWIGLVAALVVVAGLRTRRTAAAMLAIGTALTLAVMLAGTDWLPAAITGRISDPVSYFVGPDPAHTEITDDNFAVLERLAHWQAGLQMFSDHPWIGVGIGNFAEAYPSYALPHWYDALGHADNVYVNFMAETGILGAIAFIVFWLGAFRLTWQTASKARRYGAALAVGVLGTLVYLTVHNSFDNLFVQHMQLQLALLLSSVAAVNQAEARV